MPRSADLDTIAPDDPQVPSPVLASPVVNPPSTPALKKKKKIHPSPAANEFRQRVDEILATSKSSFASFVIKPQKFVFSEQEKDESIILVLRQHWFTNVSWILTALVMIFVPILFTYVPILSFFPARYQLVIILFWYLITFAFAFEKFLSWYFNLYIITDERVVDIDFINLLNKRFSDAKISFIQDVTSQVSGFSQTMFNYGDILIQTAAEKNQFIFEKVPNPDVVTKILQQLRQEEEQEAIDGRIK